MGTPLNQNLSASWEMDEASGNILDATANHNDLAPTGVTQDPPPAPGIFGHGAGFNGVNSRATIADGSQTGLGPGTGSFSIEIWLISLQSGAGTNDLLNKYDLPSGVGWRLIAPSSGGSGAARLIISDGTHSGLVTGTTVIADGLGTTLFQVGMVVDRVNQWLQLYVNGTQEGANVDITAVGSLANAAGLFLGTLSNLATPFYGTAARARFWNGRVLSSSEWTSLYNSGSGLTYAQLAPLSSGDGGVRNHQLNILGLIGDGPA